MVIFLLLLSGCMIYFFLNAPHEAKEPRMTNGTSESATGDSAAYSEQQEFPLLQISGQPDMQAETLVINSSFEDTAEFSLFFSCASFPDKALLIREAVPMRSASMIKVFILAEAMNRAAHGTLHLDEAVFLADSDKVGGAGILAGYPNGTELTLFELLRLMIIESDNTATNIMIDRLGMDAINHYIKENGYTETVLRRKMMDFEAAAGGQENYTSARDLGQFFTKLYNHRCVNSSYDDAMIGILKEQTDNEALPEALPQFVIAHKTGELIGAYHDGGILYGEKDYIFVVLTDDCQSRERTIAAIQKVASYLLNDVLGHTGEK